MFVFTSSVLAGYGFSCISKFIARKFKISNKIKAAVFIVMVSVILTELVFVKGLPQGFNIKDQFEQNELAKYLEQQEDKFRIT